MDIHRYPEKRELHTNLDPLEDVKCWIAGLKSKRYLTDLINDKHSLQGKMSLQERINTATAFIEIASEYLDQAHNGPQSVSFLPSYYAFLNLAKVYIIFGPYADELKRQRRHGVTYDPALKDSRTLETEYIRIRPKGAVTLFYRTLLGSYPLRSYISLSDIYPYILDIEAEYRTATGHDFKLAPFSIEVKEDENGKQKLYATLQSEIMLKPVPHWTELRYLKAFKGMDKDPNNSELLTSPEIPVGSTKSARDFIRTPLLYGFKQSAISETYQFVPASNSRTLLPEELPILLAFFHMSSVIRYNPQFYKKLVDSKYWPMLLTLRRHGTFKFLLLFWSFINQASYYVFH